MRIPIRRSWTSAAFAADPQSTPGPFNRVSNAAAPKVGAPTVAAPRSRALSHSRDPDPDRDEGLLRLGRRRAPRLRVRHAVSVRWPADDEQVEARGQRSGGRANLDELHVQPRPKPIRDRARDLLRVAEHRLVDHQRAHHNSPDAPPTGPPSATAPHPCQSRQARNPGRSAGPMGAGTRRSTRGRRSSSPCCVSRGAAPGWQDPRRPRRRAGSAGSRAARSPSSCGSRRRARSARGP